MKNHLPIAIIATLLLLLLVICTTTNTCNAAPPTFFRTLVYNNNQCPTSTLPQMDIYIQVTNCTANNNCTKLESMPSYYHTTQCTTTVPTTIPAKTYMLSVYDDTACDAAKLLITQINPIDTCVGSSGTYYKTSGCRTLEMYSDEKCTVFISSVDYSGRNGVCNSGRKFVCNGSTTIQKMGMALMLVALLIVGLIF